MMLIISSYDQRWSNSRNPEFHLKMYLINETNQIVYIIEVVEIREIVIMRIIRKSKSEKIEILRVDKSVFKNCLRSQNFLRCAFFQAIWDYQYFFFFPNSFTIILKSLVERYCLVSAGNVRHNRLISSIRFVSPEINLWKSVE